MKSKEILPDNFRIRPDLPSSEMVSSEYVYEYDKALKAAESEIQENGKEIKELKKKIRDLKYYHVIDTSKLQQSYRKQFDWIEQNHPEVYKQIPR